MDIVHRFLLPPKSSFFLLGPRGTGKSTWTQALFHESIRIDLLEPETFRNFSARPERLREVAQSTPAKKIIVIDEIQRVPSLLTVIHAMIEEKKGWQFVMTGSSSRKLKRTGVDLLGGRALLKTLHPFMAAELGPAFDLVTALQEGLLPLVWHSQASQEILKSYAALYVREEVQMEGLVRNIGNFSRFLEAISFSHGEVLNISNVARECEVTLKTVEGYVSVIEDLLLAFRLPVFTKRAKRAMAVHPKFYWFDAGVYQSLRPKGPLDAPEEINGHALEGLVAQHLRAWSAYGKETFLISYWRTRSGSEVDFVVYGEKNFWGIEVKNSSKIRDEELRGLQAFKQDYPSAQLIYLYRGKEILKRRDVLCVPCDIFLRQLRPDHPVWPLR